MAAPIILASNSSIRAKMMRQVGIEFEVQAARVDEESIKSSLISEGAKPRDIADILAEAKARRTSAKNPAALVIGSDQVLELNGTIISKPKDEGELQQQMTMLSGKTHKLISAAVIYEDAKPIWRHVSEARMTMRELSSPFIAKYVARNWTEIQHSVGGYMIEAEGARLFSRIHGDQFTIMGLPLLELVSYLVLRGDMDA